MIHATLTLRLAYDEASGTLEEVREACESAVQALVNGGTLTPGVLIVEEWEHEIEVTS